MGVAELLQKRKQELAAKNINEGEFLEQILPKKLMLLL